MHVLSGHGPENADSAAGLGQGSRGRGERCVDDDGGGRASSVDSGADTAGGAGGGGGGGGGGTELLGRTVRLQLTVNLAPQLDRRQLRVGGSPDFDF